MSDQCVLDGQVVPVAGASIPVTDEGLLRGDGAFEVVRLYAGRPFALDHHLRRMTRSAQTLRLEADVQGVHGDALKACELADGGDFLLRLVVTRGGHRMALLEPLPEHRDALRLAVERHQPTPLLRAAKSLSYAANMLAVRLAAERGFDDALFVLPDDRVLELTRSSFFWVDGGKILTPPLNGDEILDSITRRLVMEENDVTEQAISLGDLAGVEEAFSAGTSFEVLPVSEVEGVGTFDVPGPVTSGVMASVRARVERELEAG
ncbi:MAG: branched-chain amino acid aminotransferase [Thermoleophilaceae bacterium]|jgi:branched-chain amino acid aminotransferase|nr:branched-chain amino acid aminotransferase [Thermoleophilaceae bacterium]